MSNLISSLKAASEWCAINGVKIPPSLGIQLRVYKIMAIKSLEDYAKEIEALVKDLQSGKITQSQFEVRFNDIIDVSLEDAWTEGAGEYADDPDMLVVFSNIIDKEHSLVSEFAIALAGGMSIDAALARADLWANRWQDIKNIAVMLAAEKSGDMLTWVYGDTINHCATCKAAEGVIASAADWRESKYHPQGGEDGILPNDMLECGGWRCSCSMIASKDESNVPDGMTLDEFIESRI